MSRPKTEIYGLLAEFDVPDEVVEAAEAVHAAGYRRIDAYSPYPIEALAEALHLGRSVMSKLVLGGALCGMAAGYGLCWWSSVVAYPMNISGKPFHSWPAFIVPTYETTILFACLTAVFGMLWVNKLTQPYHPLFNVPSFTMGASRDKFYVCVEADDPRFDRAGTRRFLESLKGVKLVSEVPH